MCLAVPGRVEEITDDVALVDFGGVTREASLALVSGASVGDYVLVHAGFAIEILSEAEARETLALFRDLAGALDQDERGRAEEATSDGGEGR